MIELSKSAHQAYKEMVKDIEKEILDLHIPTSSTSITVIPHLFAHMGHSRTPSGCSVISFTSSILSEPISENYPHSEPETDSKGYEIVQKNGGGKNLFQNIERTGKEGNEANHTEVLDFDDGNEADTEDFNDLPRRSGSFGSVVRIDTDEFENCDEIDDNEDCSQPLDTVEDLPHIDSIHTSNYDLNAEILSQHSSRTLDNCEAMSTHSSKTTYSTKTLGDSGCTVMADFHNLDHQKFDITKTSESPSSTLQRGKNLDQDRIHSWVQESQNCFEHLEIDTAHDSTSSSSEEEQNDCVPVHR